MRRYYFECKEVDVEHEVKAITGKGADYIIDCAGSEETVNQSIHMAKGGKVCLAAFPKKPVNFDIGHLAVNNIYLYGIRGEGKSATHRAMAFMAEEGLTLVLCIHIHLI